MHAGSTQKRLPGTGQQLKPGLCALLCSFPDAPLRICASPSVSLFILQAHIGIHPRRLLGAAVAALGVPHCGPPARDAALLAVESLLQHQADAADVAEAVGAHDAAVSYFSPLAPHAGELLSALRAVVLASVQTTSGGGKQVSD